MKLNIHQIQHIAYFYFVRQQVSDEFVFYLFSYVFVIIFGGPILFLFLLLIFPITYINLAMINNIKGK